MEKFKEIKKITEKRLYKLIERRGKYRITFESGEEPDEIKFYRYNPFKSGEEKYLGTRRMVS